jgi:hypothetical protein
LCLREIFTGMSGELSLLMVRISKEIGCYVLQKFGFFHGKVVTNNFPSLKPPQIKLFPLPFTKLERSLSFANASEY